MGWLGEFAFMAAFIVVLVLLVVLLFPSSKRPTVIRWMLFILALPAILFLFTFAVIEQQGGTIGPDAGAIYFFAGVLSLPCALVAPLVWLVPLIGRGREYLWAGLFVVIALLGGFVAFGRFSLWF